MFIWSLNISLNFLYFIGEGKCIITLQMETRQHLSQVSSSSLWFLSIKVRTSLNGNCLYLLSNLCPLHTYLLSVFQSPASPYTLEYAGLRMFAINLAPAKCEVSAIKELIMVWDTESLIMWPKKKKNWKSFYVEFQFFKVMCLTHLKKKKLTFTKTLALWTQPVFFLSR